MDSLWSRDLEGRLDTQPLGAGHRRVTLLSGLGWMFDAIVSPANCRCIVHMNDSQ